MRKCKHGHCPVGHESRTHRAWRAMIERCNPATKNPKYKANYVAKGVTVCERWRDFCKFLEDMGECPEGLQLDRIKSEVGYTAGNCRWVTRLVQQANKTKVLKVEFNGALRTLKEVSRLTGIAYQVLRYRLSRKWPMDRMFNIP